MGEILVRPLVGGRLGAITWSRRVVREMVASFDEMLLPVHRQKLVSGIWSGYAITLGFAVLGFMAWMFHLTPWRWDYVGLIAIKLATNSLAWLALYKRRGVGVAC